MEQLTNLQEEKGRTKPSTLGNYNNYNGDEKTAPAPHVMSNQEFNKRTAKNRLGICTFFTMEEYNYWTARLQEDIEWVNSCPWKQENKDKWMENYQRFYNKHKKKIQDKVLNLQKYGVVTAPTPMQKNYNYEWKIELKYSSFDAPIKPTQHCEINEGEKGDFLPLIEDVENCKTVEETKECFRIIEEFLLDLKEQGKFSDTTIKTLENFAIKSIREYAYSNDSVFKALYGIERCEVEQLSTNGEKVQPAAQELPKIEFGEEWWKETYRLMENFTTKDELDELYERCEKKCNERFLNDFKWSLNKDSMGYKTREIPNELKRYAYITIDKIKNLI